MERIENKRYLAIQAAIRAVIDLGADAYAISMEDKVETIGRDDVLEALVEMRDEEEETR